MKFISIMTCSLLSFSAFANSTVEVNNLRGQEDQATIARVVKTIPLVEKVGGNGSNLLVNVTIVDHGGSTDVSPTQTVFLTMYVKGEMFSTDATFKIADVIKFNSAKRIKAGIYEIQALTAGENGIKESTFRIDGKKASSEIQNVKCGDFDCAASNNFATTIKVVETQK